MSSLSLRLFGRVQGVGFRWFVRAEACSLGIVGFVRNRPNGSVEVMAEGEESALAQLEAACRLGPSSAHVARAERHMEPVATLSFESFDIR